MTRTVVLMFAVGSLLAVGPATALHAQAPAADGPRGLHGGRRSDDTAARRFALGVSLFHAVDIASDGAQGSVDDAGLQVGRPYQGAFLQLGYAQRSARASFRLTGGSAWRYYRDLSGALTRRHEAATELTLRVARRGMLRVGGNASYSPRYALVLGASALRADSDLAISTVDEAATDEDAWVSGGSVEYTHQLARNTVLAMTYGTHRADFRAQPDLMAHRGGIRLQRAVGRGVILRAGYGHGNSRHSDAFRSDHVTSHDIDAGVDYRRALSFSRRTNLTFRSGSSSVTTTGGTFFRVTGGAALTHDIGGTWAARLLYDRELQLVDGLRAPVFSNSIGLRLGGFIGPRVNVDLLPEISIGDVVGGADASYSMRSSALRIGVVVTRLSTLTFEHLYRRYRSDEGAGWPEGLRASTERQGVRVGMTLSLPLATRR